jgi:hypothetical protein
MDTTTDPEINAIGTGRTFRRVDLTSQLTWRFALTVETVSDQTVRVQDLGNYGMLLPAYLSMPIVIAIAVLLGDVLGRWPFLIAPRRHADCAALAALGVLLGLLGLWAIRRCSASHRTIWISSDGTRPDGASCLAANDIAISITQFRVLSKSIHLTHWASVLWWETGQVILCCQTDRQRVEAHCDRLPAMLRSRFRGVDSQVRMLRLPIG